LKPRSDADLPSGTVTFLFTDIEASTRLWEEDADRMKTSLERHDEIILAAVHAHGGHVFNTVGDGFWAVFGRAPEAAEAALVIQRDLDQEAQRAGSRLRVRVAIHTGEADQREGVYSGAAVNRVTRLVPVAHGGQTVLSRTACDLVSGSPPDDVALRDLGYHRLHDLESPEQIYQLDHPSLRADFPPLRSLETLPHNLPLQLTSFVGREAEIGEVRELLADHRIVTLTGAGGQGKTRLALQLAAQVSKTFPDGVWFVELARLGDPMRVAQTVASALGLREVPGRDVADTLMEHLDSQAVLIVLDNCEHLIDASAHWVESALRAAPRLKVLATSRETLGIPGEVVFVVPPLAAPDIEADPKDASPSDLSAYEAVQLFVDRAGLVQSDFAIDQGNAQAIGQICARLDGIPHAIELAAARVAVLSPDQVAERLDDCFQLLGVGSRTASPRHQTLRAVIDWSHELLEQQEQVLLRRLAVFVGGWTLDAAEEIWGESGTLDLLSRLVDKSLVVAEPRDDSGMRYRLLETTRQYAREKLAAEGEAEMIERRHRDWVLALVEGLVLGLGSEVTPRLEVVAAEKYNVRAALGWSLARDETEPALRIVASMKHSWKSEGLLTEGIEWCERGLAAGSEASIARSQALSVLSALAFFHGDKERARSAANEALAVARDVSDKRSLVLALSAVGRNASLSERDYEIGTVAAEEGLKLARELGDRDSELVLLVNQGETDRYWGHLDRAEAMYEEARLRCQEYGNRYRDVDILFNLGQTTHAMGNTDEAERRYRQTAHVAAELHHPAGRLQALIGMAEVYATRGDHDRAARLLGASEAGLAAQGRTLDPPDRLLYDRSVTAAREALGERDFAAAWVEGSELTLDEAAAEAFGDTVPQ
jgi:predicted ATPase/class 3 adenylate cyclase